MGAAPRIVHKYGASTFTEPIKEYAFEVSIDVVKVNAYRKLTIIIECEILVFSYLTIYQPGIFVKMACSNIRYGYGVTQEVGMDFANMKAKKVGVYTDKNVAQLPALKVAVDSLTKAGVNFEVYDDVRVEPTDTRHDTLQGVT